MKKFKLDLLFEKSLLSEKYKKDLQLRLDEDRKDLESFQYLKSVQNSIEKFVESGDNLYIHSPVCGNGKTSWAVKLLKEYLFRVWYKSDLVCRALFISVPRFLLAIKENISEKSEYITYIKENILDADIVVFDDIAAKVGSDFEIQHLLNYIDNRISLGKTNIYTSNLSRKEMFTAVGERLTSRITNFSEEIELFGADKRNLAFKGDISND